MPKLPRVTAKEVERVLIRAGFEYSHSTGSHRRFKNSVTNRNVTVAFHSGEIIPPGTLKNILKQANLSIDEFNDLL